MNALPAPFASLPVFNNSGMNHYSIIDRSCSTVCLMLISHIKMHRLYYNVLFFLNFFFFNVYLFLGQRETEHERGRGRERGRHRIGNRLQALSHHQHRARRGARTPGPRDRDLAEVGRFTDCATQAPQYSSLKEKTYIPDPKDKAAPPAVNGR